MFNEEELMQIYQICVSLLKTWAEGIIDDYVNLFDETIKKLTGSKILKESFDLVKSLSTISR